MKKATGTKKWIRLSMILYIVILSGAAVFTLAWFVFDETATIKTADNMQITAGTKLEIALVEDGKDLEWGQLIACNTPTTLPDITGNGSVFYFPKAQEFSFRLRLNGSRLFFSVCAGRLS